MTLANLDSNNVSVLQDHAYWPDISPDACRLTCDPKPPYWYYDTAINFAAGDGPISIAAGDFNADANLAVADFATDKVSLLLNQR